MNLKFPEPKLSCDCRKEDVKAVLRKEFPLGVDLVYGEFIFCNTNIIMSINSDSDSS